jgi:hypothetical protein
MLLGQPKANKHVEGCVENGSLSAREGGEFAVRTIRTGTGDRIVANASARPMDFCVVGGDSRRRFAA